jgi:hypothetical protein
LIRATSDDSLYLLFPPRNITCRSDRCSVTNRLLRPRRMDVVQGNRCAKVVDFETPDMKDKLADFGQASTPCGNAACCGKDGKWDTTPQKNSTKTAAPTIVLDAEGRSTPLVSARSKCLTCGTNFPHFNPTTLERMPPGALNGLDVDPQWARGDVVLSKSLSTPFEYDATTRQGAENCATKTAILGSETYAEDECAYYAHSQTWRTQLEKFASDEAWCELSVSDQIQLAVARAEWLLANELCDAVEPFGMPCDRNGFSLNVLSPSRLLVSLSEVLQARRPELRAQMCEIGAEEWVSLDFARRQGQQVGGGWLATLTNERGELISSLITSGVKMDAELLAWLEPIGRRENFRAKIMVIDNTPPDVERSTWCSRLKETLGLDYVVQDKLHVSKNLSKFFNNTHPRFFKLVIMGWRETYSYLDPELEKENDDRLKKGLVAKDILFRGERVQITRDMPMTDARIAELKASGAYHELFTAADSCVVPRRVYPLDQLEPRVATWRDTIIADAKSTQPREKAIVGDILDVPRLAENALKRIKNCVPPCDHAEFFFTGETDFNGGRVVAMNFHTCHNECWNGLVLDFVCGDNVEEGLGAGLYMEGMTRLNGGRLARRRAAEDLIHNKPFLARKANYFAGHGDDADDSMVPVVQRPPHNVKRPRQPDPGETCVSGVPYNYRVAKNSLIKASQIEPVIEPESALLLRPSSPRPRLFQVRPPRTLQPPLARAHVEGSVPATETTLSRTLVVDEDEDDSVVVVGGGGEGRLLSSTAGAHVDGSVPATETSATETSLSRTLMEDDVVFVGVGGGESRLLSSTAGAHVEGSVPATETSLLRVDDDVVVVVGGESRLVSSTAGADVGSSRHPPRHQPILRPPAASKLPGRSKEQQNKWPCICRPLSTQATAGRGRVHHNNQCIRQQWAYATDLPEKPPKGHILKLLDSALLPGAGGGGHLHFDGRQWELCDHLGQPTQQADRRQQP